jgi:hypothetical protein
MTTPPVQHGGGVELVPVLHSIRTAVANEPAAIVVSESGATGETKKAAQRFSAIGALTGKPLRHASRFTSSVFIRPLIATPAQGSSRS